MTQVNNNTIVTVIILSALRKKVIGYVDKVNGGIHHIDCIKKIHWIHGLVYVLCAADCARMFMWQISVVSQRTVVNPQRTAVIQIFGTLPLLRRPNG